MTFSSEQKYILINFLTTLEPHQIADIMRNNGIYNEFAYDFVYKNADLDKQYVEYNFNTLGQESDKSVYIWCDNGHIYASRNVPSFNF